MSDEDGDLSPGRCPVGGSAHVPVDLRVSDHRGMLVEVCFAPSAQLQAGRRQFRPPLSIAHLRHGALSIMILRDTRSSSTPPSSTVTTSASANAPHDPEIGRRPEVEHANARATGVMAFPRLLVPVPATSHRKSRWRSGARRPAGAAGCTVVTRGILFDAELVVNDIPVRPRGTPHEWAVTPELRCLGHWDPIAPEKLAVV
jgi:hypothetical protein